MEKHSFEVPAFSESTLLLENLQGGIVYSDSAPPFHLRYVTDGLVHMSGYTHDELLRMQQMDLVCEEDVDSLTEEVARQLSNGDTFEVEYRLKRKDGSYIFVLDRAKVVLHNDGENYIHCLLTDITALKQMEQALRLSEEKYKLAIQQSGNVILEYDINQQVLQFSENFHAVFGHTPPPNPPFTDWVAPQDSSMIAALFRAALEQKKALSAELRIPSDTGACVWASITLAPVILSDGKVHAVVGCLQNIDKHKRQVAELTERAQKDGLTNVYNRVTMEKLITQRLTDSDCAQNHALLLMDIDFFKDVNDQHGHDVGDHVLIRVAQIVGKALPETALFGRLGGDEFLIFAPAKGAAALEQLSAHLVEAVRCAFAGETCAVTVSIGGTLCATEQSFHPLYRCADLALYESKNKGRNTYTVRALDPTPAIAHLSE